MVKNVNGLRGLSTGCSQYIVFGDTEKDNIWWFSICVQIFIVVENLLLHWFVLDECYFGRGAILRF